MCPFGFLDLPREIRDVIYQYALIASTGYVELVPSRASTTTLKIATRATRNGSPSVGRATINIYTKDPSIISPSTRAPATSKWQIHTTLSRTCRTIYHETQHLLWARNTFYFSPVTTIQRPGKNIRALYCGKGPTAVTHMGRCLKIMGQDASRRIRAVAIEVSAPLSTLDLALLLSRARVGALRRVELYAVPKRGHLSQEALAGSLYDLLQAWTMSSNWERLKRLAQVKLVLPESFTRFPGVCEGSGGMDPEEEWLRKVFDDKIEIRKRDG